MKNAIFYCFTRSSSSAGFEKHATVFLREEDLIETRPKGLSPASPAKNRMLKCWKRGYFFCCWRNCFAGQEYHPSLGVYLRMLQQISFDDLNNGIGRKRR